MAAVGAVAAVVGRPSGRVSGAIGAVLPGCGLLAALSHHQTALGIRHAVEGQEPGAGCRRDALGPVVSAGLGSNPLGPVRSQNTSDGRKLSDPNGGCDRRVCRINRDLRGLSNPEMACWQADESAQAAAAG